MHFKIMRFLILGILMLSFIIPNFSISESRSYVGTFKITFYDACKYCTGNTKGITASGKHVKEGVTISADPRVLPMGSKVYIKDIGYRIVQDTGSAIKGRVIDVYVPTHNMAVKLGMMYKKVYIINY